MANKRENPRKDFTQVALAVVEQATGEIVQAVPSKTQARARKGGLKGGLARASKLTAEQRADIARRAALKRWQKPIERVEVAPAAARKKAKVAV